VITSFTAYAIFCAILITQSGYDAAKKLRSISKKKISDMFCIVQRATAKPKTRDDIFGMVEAHRIFQRLTQIPAENSSLCDDFDDATSTPVLLLFAQWPLIAISDSIRDSFRSSTFSAGELLIGLPARVAHISTSVGVSCGRQH
jgi:hypothetical protein